MRIATIRIYKIRWNLTEEQVFSCRVYGDEDTLERESLKLWTEWMHQNPGVPTRMNESSTSNREQGGD